MEKYVMRCSPSVLLKHVKEQGGAVWYFRLRHRNRNSGIGVKDINAGQLPLHPNNVQVQKENFGSLSHYSSAQRSWELMEFEVSKKPFRCGGGGVLVETRESTACLSEWTNIKTSLSLSCLSLGPACSWQTRASSWPSLVEHKRNTQLLLTFVH